MLRLLIKTRLRYYRNYIRYHFDRTTLVEIGIIFFIFLLLLGRSPADIGFNLNWFTGEDFFDKWTALWLTLLPFVYIFSELFAHQTFRITHEQQILGILPFHTTEIARYYLFRLVGKLSLLILPGSLPFWAGKNMAIGLKALHFLTALGLLMFLILFSFMQAYSWRTPRWTKLKRIGRWLLLDVAILAVLVHGTHFFTPIFKGAVTVQILGLVLAWIFVLFLFKRILTSFILSDATARRQRLYKNKTIYSTRLMNGVVSAFIGNDILFLLRQKRSAVFIPMGGMLIMTIIALFEAQVNAVFAGLIIVEIISSFFLIKSVMLLFENDADSIVLLKSFPATSGQKYNARWCLLYLIVVIQSIIPLLIILIKFEPDVKIGVLSGVTLFLLPAILATLYCNTGFGLFPHFRLFEIIFTITLLFMFLFWFFMPFGTVIILFLILFWIRKSRRNFKFSEIV